MGGGISSEEEKDHDDDTLAIAAAVTDTILGTVVQTNLGDGMEEVITMEELASRSATDEDPQNMDGVAVNGGVLNAQGAQQDEQQDVQIGEPIQQGVQIEEPIQQGVQIEEETIEVRRGSGSSWFWSWFFVVGVSGLGVFTHM